MATVRTRTAMVGTRTVAIVTVGTRAVTIMTNDPVVVVALQKYVDQS